VTAKKKASRKKKSANPANREPTVRESRTPDAEPAGGAPDAECGAGPRRDRRARRRLLVVDGANTIYRAFFAIPNLRAPDGAPTGAAYGFINTVNKLIREEQPDFVAIAMDPRGWS